MKKQVKDILTQILQLTEQLTQIRNKCKHKNKTYTYSASTGNYDPSNDRYWKNYECPDCGKKWSEDCSTYK